MYKKIINFITSVIINTINMTDENDIEILRYGVTVKVYNLWKTITLLLIYIISGKLFDGLFFTLCFMSIRKTAFGVHINSSVGCLLFGLLFFVGFPLISPFYNFTLIQTVVFFIIVFITNIKYAPAPTDERPISKNDSVIFRKKTLITITILFIIALIFTGNLRNLIIYAVLGVTLCTLPITYKILKKERCSYV